MSPAHGMHTPRVLLNAHEWGDAHAPPIVCLHGVAGHGRRFRRLAQESLASRFHVIALDLRGHGRSFWDAPWNIETHVEDVLETLDRLSIQEESTWIGHSFGGRLVLEIAAREPGLVGRTVLLDPAIQLPGGLALALAEDERQKPAWFDSVEKARAWRSARTHLAPSDMIDEELVDHLEDGPDGRVRFRYAASAAAAMYGELARDRPDLSALRARTLIVLASVNSAAAPMYVEELRSALGDELLVVTVPGGHIVTWEAYEATRDAVAAFLLNLVT